MVRGLSCQLSLAGCIAQSGNFPSLDKNLPVAALEYWKVSASASEKERIKDSEVTNIIDNAHEGLKQLITDFNQETTPYLACPDPGIAPKYNDYEHLERLQEWDN